MPLSLIQTASGFQFSQSPVMFTISTGDITYTSSRFQYTCDLTYWTGNRAVSSSGNTYSITKYPNVSGSGFFDFSRMLNSALRGNMVENTSSVLHYKATFSSQNYSGSGFVTGSKINTTVKSVTDGYGLWGDVINKDISSTDMHPFLTDGPATQSVFAGDKGTLSVDAPFGGTAFTYTFKYTNTTTTEVVTVTGSLSTRVKRLVAAPGQAGFNASLTNLEHFTISSGSKSIRYNIGCETKYTPVRIGWKNRFGQPDFFTFNKVSKETFSTNQKTYSPNAGNYDGSLFSADGYANQSQKYIIDTTQTLDVNTDYISEAYNEIFKQLMVSDEVYLYGRDGSITPLSIESNSITFKKGVNEKLIQYTMRFNIGRNFKFIL